MLVAKIALGVLIGAILATAAVVIVAGWIVVSTPRWNCEATDGRWVAPGMCVNR